MTLLPEVFNLLMSNLTNKIAYKIEDQIYKCRFNQVISYYGFILIHDECVVLYIARGCAV